MFQHKRLKRLFVDKTILKEHQAEFIPQASTRNLLSSLKKSETLEFHTGQFFVENELMLIQMSSKEGPLWVTLFGYASTILNAHLSVKIWTNERTFCISSKVLMKENGTESDSLRVMSQTELQPIPDTQFLHFFTTITLL